MDLRLVREILTHPAIWPHVGDDFAGRPEDWQPNDDPRIWYVLAMEDGRPVGLFTFLPRSAVLWEAHIALLKHRKTRGPEIARAALDWMFEHSTTERIIAEIPECNRLAVALAGWVMERYGVNKRAFMKGGILRDLVLFGLSKGGNQCPA